MKNQPLDRGHSMANPQKEEMRLYGLFSFFSYFFTSLCSIINHWKYTPSDPIKNEDSSQASKSAAHLSHVNPPMITN